METSISTIIVMVVIIFLIYQSGLMRLAQNSSDRIISTADEGLEQWHYDLQIKRARKYKKLEAKIDKDSMSSASVIKKMLKELEATE